jgi:hypothetical protein
MKNGLTTENPQSSRNISFIFQPVLYRQPILYFKQPFRQP